MMEPVVLDVSVPLEDPSYPVIVGAGVLSRLGRELRARVPKAKKIALVADATVMGLYGGRVRAELEASGVEVVAFDFPAGEASKSVERLVTLVGALLAAGLGRHDAVVALGGGVTGDLAGLVAGVFMRGIPFVQCPTSLLAQVDASVGGKVAVDMEQGKNLLGVFHFPRAVLIDPDVLQTLPDDELGCGLAEMLKHGALFSPEHVEDLLTHADEIYARDGVVLGRLVAASVALKAACVARDPWERAGQGRVLLNLGHTVGHAIEAASEFGLKHGQAVALGLRAAARLSERSGWAEPGLEAFMVTALERLRLPTELDVWLSGARGEVVARALAHDKKRALTRVTYIGLARLGEPKVAELRPDEILALLRA